MLSDESRVEMRGMGEAIRELGVRGERIFGISHRKWTGHGNPIGHAFGRPQISRDIGRV
jgi:hypothetical protein